MSAGDVLVLDELQLDALTELVNIGVSRAAASLRTMIGQEVLLSAPSVAIVGRQRAAEIIGASEVRFVAVHQAFEGDISGRALLIFPETNSLELVRAVVGDDLPLEDVIDLGQEALTETGNVILNACLATIANLLQRNLRMSLPEVIRGGSQDFFGPPGPRVSEMEDDCAVLFLYIDFRVNARDIRGYIAMLMDLPAMTSLKELLTEFIQRTIGEVPTNHGGA